MPIDVERLGKKTKDKSEIVEEIMSLLSSNKDKAFKSSEIANKVDYHNPGYVRSILTELKIMGKVNHNRPWWFWPRKEGKIGGMKDANRKNGI